MNSGVEIIWWLQSFRTPWLDRFFMFWSWLGTENFFLILLPVLYLVYDKRFTVRLTTLFLLSVWLNASWKDRFATLRPGLADGVTPLYVESGGGYAFPSNHAQNAVLVWFYTAWRVRRRWFTWLAAAVVLLISLSRLYLGLHWPVDVVGGLLLGTAFLALGTGLGSSLSAWLIGWHWSTRLLGAILLPFGLLLIYSGELAWVAIGALIGYLAGAVMEEQWVGFDSRDRWPIQILKIALGVGLVFGLRFGLKLVIPDTGWGDLIRYAVIGWSGGFLVPWLSVRFAGARRISLSGTVAG